MRQHFRTTLRDLGDQPWKLLVVPFDPRREFGVDGETLPVLGTLNGAPFRSRLALDGSGRYFMTVNEELRREAHADTEVDVVMDLDDAPRKFSIPPQLRALLAGDAAATRVFEAMPDEDRRQFARWVGSGDKRETKEQRAIQAIAMIKAGETL